MAPTLGRLARQWLETRRAVLHGGDRVPARALPKLASGWGWNGDGDIDGGYPDRADALGDGAPDLVEHLFVLLLLSNYP